MRNKTGSIGLAILALGVSMSAHAQEESGFYVGAAVGKADNQSGEFHGDDTAFELFGGYTFNDYLSVELAYVDAGTQRDRIGDIDVANSSSGVIASILPTLPLGESLAVFARLGYAFYESDAEFRSGDQVATDSDSDSDLVYGGGIQYRFAERFTIRADYEYVDISDGDFYIATVGATVRF
jgi:OmpA-OmpF porin, OOP family